MRFNNYSRVILQTNVMILPSCAKLILVFLLAILHKVLGAAVTVIDKTDCIMKDINMQILLKLLDYLWSQFCMEALIVFTWKVRRQDSVLNFMISTFKPCLTSVICVSGKVSLEVSW